MFAATRRWFRRNRTPIAVGVGLVGAGYVVTQYVLNKLNDARERMSSDRIAKENLRRRFQQNQEDCTYTVLALLPTAATKILETLDVEKITLEIQQMKGGSSSSRGTKSDSMSLPETATGMTDEDGQSMISTSESGVHASQITVPPASQTAEGDQPQTQPERPKRTKRQLWGDVTISSITRAFTFVYTLALLTMLTRIQLNLLGRRSYLSSVVSLATGANTGAISLENKDDDNNATEAYGDDFEVNRKYLTFSWWLLNRGWMDVMQRVEAAVREVFGQLSPRDQLTYETFSNLTAQVRKLVEGGGGDGGGGRSVLSVLSYEHRQQQQQTGAATLNQTNWLTFLLPPPDMEDYVLRESGILDDSATYATQQGSSSILTSTTTLEREPPSPTTSSSSSAASLRRLLDETSDIVETPTFAHVLTQILDAGFTVLLDKKLAPGAFDLDLSSSTNTTTTTTTATNPSSSASRPTTPLPAAQFLVLNDNNTPATTTSDEEQQQQQRTRKRMEKKVLLPKCLSILTRQAHAMGDAMPTNEYLAAMEGVRDLEGFAAVVYSSNWQNEIGEDEMLGVAASGSSSSSTGSAGSSSSSSQRPGTAAAAAATTTTTTTATDSDVRPSQQVGEESGGGGGGGAGEESMVLVNPSQDNSSSFEHVWAKVTER